MVPSGAGGDGGCVVSALSLVGQQELIRRAIDVLDRGADPDTGCVSAEIRSTVGFAVKASLYFALADHEDPDTGCLAGEGEECRAVVTARRILAGAQS